MNALTRARIHLRGRRASLALVGALAGAAVLSSPALAAGGPPIPRIYDCYGYSSYGVINYVSALELRSRSEYVVAPSRKGNRLVGRSVPGTYRLNGSRLTFLTGPYGRIHWTGEWVLKRVTDGGDAAHIGLISPKTRQTVLECYPH
jgi:hypothetical protein